MSDIEYSVITSDVIKSFDCICHKENDIVNYITPSGLYTYCFLPVHPSVSLCPSQIVSNLVIAILTVLSVSFFKLCRCFCQGLKMCMTFGCNPQINFVTFFAVFT